jgi:hypothetical protein
MNRMGKETRGTFWPLATTTALVMVPSLVTASKAPIQPPPPTSSKPQIVESYSKLPLAFEANDGQADRRVTFLARGKGYTLFLTREEAVMVLRAREEERGSSGSSRSFGSAGAEPSVSDQTRQTRETKQTRQTVLRMRLEGSNPSPLASGLEPLPGIVNYFIGNDPKKWRTNIPTYEKVEYKNIYSGIDLVYYGNQGKLEYDFVVSPGSDPNQIKLAFQGAGTLKTDADGHLVLAINGGEVRQLKPHVYQVVEGKRVEIAAAYILEPLSPSPLPAGERVGVRGESLSTRAVGFGIAAYDANKPLIIDPVLSYATYLGGSSADLGSDIAVDAAGSAYVTGVTVSADFPTTLGAFDTTFNGGDEAFVTKLNPTGSALVFSTYLGGSRTDQGAGIAVDATSQAYVTGVTVSFDFPTTLGAFDTTFNAGNDANDAFVTKLNPAGSALVYSTYLGGSNADLGGDIAVDATGDAYVTGTTNSANFPTTLGTFDTTFNGVDDAFVTKLNPTGSALVYATYLGGSSTDFGFGIAVDTTEQAYVTGETVSTNFPVTAGAFQTGFGRGFDDAFVTKLNPAGSALVFSTYLGGSNADLGFDIAVDATDQAYVTGRTESANFPTTLGAFDTTFNGGNDAFVTKLNPAGSALIFSTYLGGSGQDQGSSIAVDATGQAYLMGTTNSANFPTTLGAFDTTFNAGNDAFVAKISDVGPPATLTLDPAADTNVVDTQHCVTATVKDSSSNPTPGVTVRFSVTGSVTTSGSATTDANGEAIFCYTGPEAPGTDAITAYADTNNNNVQDAGEPTGAAAKTWVASPPASQTFATFRPEVEIKMPRGANNDTFEVEAFFALGAGAEIFPLTEDVTLRVGPYSTTILAGSFRQRKGRFEFKEVIDGVRLAASIQPLSRGGFQFEAEGTCVDLTGTVNPVTVELTIGNDVGSATVRADISSRSQWGKCGERRDDDDDKHDKHDKGDDDD